jgi:hypothetical protein
VPQFWQCDPSFDDPKCAPRVAGNRAGAMGRSAFLQIFHGLQV